MLSRLVDHLKARIDEGHHSCLGPYQSALAELARLDLEAARGSQVRSRVKWVEDGETSSSFSFRLERKQSMDRCVSPLRESDGTIISDIGGLCQSFASFYSDLFSSSTTDPVVQDSLLNNISSVLPPSDASICDGRLSVEECFAALSGMARNKSPGSDGLPMEFYLKFWDLLGSDLVSV